MGFSRIDNFRSLKMDHNSTYATLRLTNSYAYIGALTTMHTPPIKLYINEHAVVCLVKFIRSFNLGDKMRMRDTKRIDRNAASVSAGCGRC